MKRLSRSLTARLAAAAVVVALLGASVTLGVAYQLVRAATVEQSQTLLRSTARIVAKAPPKERAALVENLDQADAHSIQLLLVRADGTQVPAHSNVTKAAVQAVLTRGTASERYRSSGRVYLLEGVRVSQGDAVIAIQDFSLIRASTLRLFDRYLIAAAIGAALAAVLGAVVAGRIVHPLKRTAAVARRLAAGERGTSAPRRAPVAEVAEIDSALATLDEALSTSEGRQQEFLLSISHEIRTPLSGIRGYADALADGLISGDRVRHAGRTLVEETARLDSFIRDLLELARLQADDFPLRIQPCAFTPIIERAREAWRPVADRAGIRIEADMPDASTTLTTHSDPMRIRQLLDGLLENALRASPPGSAVRISVRLGTITGVPAVGISVSDEGPGLRPEDIDDAFERGVLANRYRNTRPVGTGLGLSIAARLARRLGGRISASSSDGRTVFTIMLPADQMSTRPARAVPGPTTDE